MNVPLPIERLILELEGGCPDDDAREWPEERVAEYIGESFLDGLDEPNLTPLLRRSVAFYLWWAAGR